MQERVNLQLGRNRQLVAPMDDLRASDFVAAILSGANNYTSGQMVLSGVASSVILLRPVNIHMQNRETSYMTVLFRDGGISGSEVAGPYILNATQERTIPLEELRGRYFLSGIYAVVISGTYGAGIDVNIGYIKEPDPTNVGGYLE